jgi:hypothetical protein
LQLYALLWSSSISQKLQNFDIILSSEERSILIGHLDLGDLSDVFLTKRQRLAVQEEEYLRSQGFKPFSEESDGLIIKGSREQAFSQFSNNLNNVKKVNMATFVDFGVNTLGSGEKGSDAPVEDPNASLTFPLSNIQPHTVPGLSIKGIIKHM